MLLYRRTTMTKTAPSVKKEFGSSVEWSAPEQKTYRCEARIEKDSECGFVAYVAELKGVISEGDDLESTKKNITEALKATIDTYISDHTPIPWNREIEQRSDKEMPYWIFVN